MPKSAHFEEPVSENDMKTSVRNLSFPVFHSLSSYAIDTIESEDAKNNRKIIISCAITGSVHTPTMSEYLPITPSQIVDSAAEAAEAGAAILHIHARDPENGKPSADPKHYQMICPALAERTDAVINITTGGSTQMTIEERARLSQQAKPEMCSLNMGSMNFSIHPVAEKITNWRYDWEKPKVEGMKDCVFKNTFADIEYILSNLGESGTRFELECYDVGHLYNLAYFVDRKYHRAADLYPGYFRDPRWARSGPGKPLRHAVDGRPFIRARCLSIFGIGRRTPPDVFSHHGSDHGLKCPCGAGRQRLSRPRHQGDE